MKLWFHLFLLIVVVAVLATVRPGYLSAAESPSFPAQQSNAAPGDATQPANTYTIPGPLRSFLRMSGISLEVTPPEVLPILAHTVVLQGYQLGRPTEFLILIRRYVNQSRELSTLAGQNSNIHVNGCKDAEPLLRVLGYRVQGECGKNEMSLITADPEKAFLTIDSGFPLLDLESALQHDGPFSYDYRGTTVPVVFTPGDWVAAADPKIQERHDFLEALLYEANLARLYWAVSRIEPQARAVLKKDIGLARLVPLASVLDLYGSQLCVGNGVVAVPGSHTAEKQWQEIVGANPKSPAEFILQLLTRDHGWIAAYYDAMARTGQAQQEHFANGQRIKRYYAAFRSPGASSDAGARLPFRPAPALMVLVTRMQWDDHGEPYVPGNLDAWSDIVHQKNEYKFAHTFGKHAFGFKNQDQLAEAMFALSRLESDTGPVQAYLFFSELDHKRASGQHLGPSTVVLMASKFPDFSNQYLIFSEFPELTDNSIVHFLETAEALNKISDHTLRGNAMGIFQANVSLWQILARQGQISSAQLNSSWAETIKPFSDVSTAAQLFTAGRESVERVFRAASGKTNLSQEDMIDVLAGAHQSSAEAQQVHIDVANRIRAVLDDQRLVSVDTLLALDDGLKSPTQVTNNKDQLTTLAGELREFEMPQPIFSNSEHNRWAAGTYNNRHTELQMHTDIVKIIKSPATPKQLETARGQLAQFLRDTLVGMNYAYYEPPGSQVLHNNPLFVRSHDFSGDTVMGVERLWQAPRLFGAGSPAGGGAHLIGSLADLPYVLAETEQDFIAPDHVQALIWQQFVPGLLSNAVVPRWWNVSRNEVHAVALYQRAGDELLTASTKDEELRGKVVSALSERLFPERRARLEQELQSGNATGLLQNVSPADVFYLAAEFQQEFPSDLETNSAAGRELQVLLRTDSDDVNWQRLSRDFGVIHPIFIQTYGREFINIRPFPSLGGNYNRLMGECWDSGNLYWARLADEMGYPPVLLNRIVPTLTRRMVERISASDLEDWPATLRALHETGEEVRQGKISFSTGIAEARVN